MNLPFKIALFALGVLMITNQSQPRGIRNNNPGNIRGSEQFKWNGEIGRDDKDFVIFDTPENGLRALARTLQTYRNSHGLNTIEGIINRWAPDSENNTESYITHATRQLNMPRYAPLSPQDYPRLMAVIVAHENGVQPFALAELQEGYKNALA